MTKQKAERIAKFRQAKGMEEGLYYILQLEETQKENLQPIIKKNFEEVAEFNKENRLKKEEMIATLKQAIAPSLSEAQIERFDHFAKRLKRMPRKGKKKKKKAIIGKKC